MPLLCLVLVLLSSLFREHPDHHHEALWRYLSEGYLGRYGPLLMLSRASENLVKQI